MKLFELTLYLGNSYCTCRKIFAFDTDRKRLAVMQRLMRTAGADCVTATNCSFLEVSAAEGNM